MTKTLGVLFAGCLVALSACGEASLPPDAGAGGGQGGGGGAGGGAAGPSFASVTLQAGTPGEFSGSAEVPVGYTIDGTVAIACKRLGEECDSNAVVSVQVVGTGRTGTFTLSGLLDADYAVLLFKDVNGNQDFEAGDLYGAWTDSRGDLRWLRPGWNGSLVAMEVVPADTQPAGTQDAGTPTVTPTALPAALVGSWTSVSTTSATGYTFRADGTYSYSGYFRLTVQSGCTRAGIYTAPYIFIATEGVASVAGNQLTIEDRSGIYQRDVNCSYSREGANLRTQGGTFTLGTHPSGKASLSVLWSGSATQQEYLADTGLPPNPAP